MKVAMDATPLTLKSGGIARYTAELSKALAKSFQHDEVILLSDQPFEAPTSPLANLRSGSGPKHWWENRWWLYGLSRELRRQGADVFHGTHFLVPWLPLCPSVATVHDLSPWMDSSWQGDACLVRRRAPLLIRLGIAAMLITPTEAVRRQVMEHFRIPPWRIVAVPLAASAHFRPVTGEKPSAPYFLFVGTLELRKNVSIVLEAWREVRKLHCVDLVVAGRTRSDYAPLVPEPGLHLLGEIEDEALPILYSGALACMYPSHYEGFGLPVLEAMQCGAAVVVSQDPAIREVAGAAAVLAPADDGKAWVEAMTAAVTRPDLLSEWRRRSLDQAKSFSWARTAMLTRQVYLEAIRRAGRDQ